MDERRLRHIEFMRQIRCRENRRGEDGNPERNRWWEMQGYTAALLMEGWELMDVDAMEEEAWRLCGEWGP